MYINTSSAGDNIKLGWESIKHLRKWQLIMPFVEHNEISMITLALKASQCTTKKVNFGRNYLKTSYAAKMEVFQLSTNALEQSQGTVKVALAGRNLRSYDTKVAKLMRGEKSYSIYKIIVDEKENFTMAQKKVPLATNQLTPPPTTENVTDIQVRMKGVEMSKRHFDLISFSQ